MAHILPRATTLHVARILAAIIGIGLSGCRARKVPPAATRAPERGAGQVVLDGLTGRSAVEAGRRAETVIRKVSAQQARDLAEVLEP